MNKATANYWVDMLIGVAFVLSAISGLVFLLPGDIETGVLWVSYQAWNALHTWSSLAMIVGVGLHLALHWKWLVSMTKRLFKRPPARTKLEPVVVCVEARDGDARGGGVNRRNFICMGLAGLATLAGTAAAVKVLSGDETVAEAAPEEPDVSAESASEQAIVVLPTDTAQPALAPAALATATVAATNTKAAPAQPVATSTPAAAKKLTVKCPKGLTYDRYPGRCRLYRDTNGDGYCDYSIPS
ncbi:MAG: DUF4405 domain-containing protein [Chloroflexi bacterium]|nr:DUF4405 domain-containing protein [Chloroflexota bacterium]